MTGAESTPWWKVRRPTHRPSSHRPRVIARERSIEEPWRRQATRGYGRAWWTR